MLWVLLTSRAFTSSTQSKLCCGVPHRILDPCFLVPFVLVIASHLHYLSISMAGLGRRTHYRKHLTDSVMYDLPEPKDHERIAKVVATRGGNQFDVLLASSSTSVVSDHDHGNDDQGNHDEGNDATHTNQQTVSSSSTASASAATPQLAILPTKFNKLVWLKRNDFVIVETGNQQDEERGHDDDDNEGGGVRCIISHILYKDQIKHLQRKNLWPVDDPNFHTGCQVERQSNNTATVIDETQQPQKLIPSSNNNNNNDNNADDDDNNYGGHDDDDEYADEGDEDSKEEGEHLATTASRKAVDDDDGIVYDNGYNEDDVLFVNTNHIANMKLQDSSEEEEEEDGE